MRAGTSNVGCVRGTTMRSFQFILIKSKASGILGDFGAAQAWRDGLEERDLERDADDEATRLCAAFLWRLIGDTEPCLA